MAPAGRAYARRWRPGPLDRIVMPRTATSDCGLASSPPPMSTRAFGVYCVPRTLNRGFLG